MKKRIFWKKSNVESIVPCAPCPFVGKTISSPEEFIKFLTETLFVRDGGVNEAGRPTGKYPCVDFSTKNPNQHLLFAGFGFCFKSTKVRRNGEPYKWCLFDDLLGKTIAYYDLHETDELNAVFNLFEDDAAVQSHIDLMTALVNKNGGITIQVR